MMLTVVQEKLFNKMLVLRDLIADQDFRTEDCFLLRSQLRSQL